MNDQYEGQGGSYVIGEAGRELVARTREACAEPEAAPAATQEAQQAAAPTSKSAAKASQPSPVAPADSTTQPE